MGFGNTNFRTRSSRMVALQHTAELHSDINCGDGEPRTLELTDRLATVRKTWVWWATADLVL
jgi:hypothetical protein